MKPTKDTQEVIEYASTQQDPFRQSLLYQGRIMVLLDLIYQKLDEKKDSPLTTMGV